MDRNSFRDAIEAEHLAAGLCSAIAFRGSQSHVESDTIDKYARTRAEALRDVLSGSNADVQWAFEQVNVRWRGIVSFRDPARVISLLVLYARHLLHLDGREMILKVDRDDPGREILRWRFVSLALPPSVLIAAASPKGVTPPADIRLLHRSMAPDGPVAHQHVHHAAVVSFEELWGTLRLRALLEPTRFWDSFRDKRAFCPGLHPGICIGGRREEERDCGKRYPHARQKHLVEWGALVRLAFFARAVLERHLLHHGELWRCKACAIGRQMVHSLIAASSVPYAEVATSYPWPDDLVALRRQQRESERVDRSRARPASATDFTARLAAGERVLLVRAFDRVGPLERASADELYEKLLLQYLRVKSAVFGLLVHPPGEHGLEKFLDHFQQIKVYAPEADVLVPRPPHELGLDVRATEYRVAPDAWFRVRRRAEIERPGVRAGGQATETGWLIHFKRQAAGKELPLHAGSIRSMDAESDQIVRYIDAEPGQLKSLRGIDICGVEESQPCWVVAETLRLLRKRSAEIASRNGHLQLQPLRLTLHAGEDFQCLTSGVRAMAEPFVWNLIQRGDRIGHGIAITLEPRKWWVHQSREVIWLRRFDRLLNLAFLAEYVPHANRDQHEWLRVSLTDLVTKLRLEPALASRRTAIEVDVVATSRALWRCLGTAATRRLLATPNSGVSGEIRHLQWIHRYLWNRSIHDAADKMIPMLLEGDRGTLSIASDRNELDLLVKARKRLIRQIARWQICIESNPSSNLLVGSLDSMLAQDFLHRRPTNPADEEGEETLPWTISTDDPITFSTTLADEYAYAWAGMVLRKDRQYDPAYARAMLDEAAATSMRTRFTIPSDDERKRKRPSRSRARRD